jgi:hypothetical protein
MPLKFIAEFRPLLNEPMGHFKDYKHSRPIADKAPRVSSEK